MVRLLEITPEYLSGLTDNEIYNLTSCIAGHLSDNGIESPPKEMTNIMMPKAILRMLGAGEVTFSAGERSIITAYIFRIQRMAEEVLERDVSRAPAENLPEYIR